MNEILAIGRRARAALERSGGVAQPLAAFPDAPYFDAAGEIVWVGSKLPARHPRAVLTAQPVTRSTVVSFGALPGKAWSCSLTAPTEPRAAAEACRRLVADVGRLGAPRGFGALLAGATPAFPLDLAAPRVRALAAAYSADDAQAAYEASRALLGLGTGLTPSGDDLAGAALFGRMLVDYRGGAWRAIGARLASDARTASHAISAALLADLVRGETFEPLHALADALAAGDGSTALGAARTLVALGHSSGWDMLTGFAIGITGDTESEAGRKKGES
ncbi:MAG TPA: DUF2877 domain-containing protein [Burkholderiales bacterium]|nr:DUF2877 domain-containing protein [Burkholderiales bacterium]